MDGVDGVDGVDKSLEKSSLRAVKTETAPDGQKRLDNPDSVHTVRTVHTTSRWGGVDACISV